MNGVVSVQVEPDDADIRLDRWFRRHYPEVRHGRLEKLLRTGQIRVDGARAKASTRLGAGQTVRVPPLGDAGTPRIEQPPRISEADRAWMRSLVLYEDDDVIALAKPPGIAVQGGKRIVRHIDGLLDAFDGPRPKLVHRLDRDTSGVLLLGRNARAAAALAEGFRGRDAVKVYWALVVGIPARRRGTVRAAVAKQAGADGRERVVAGAATGRHAVTDYVVVDAASRRVAWLALKPHTGRTHQIRVHCAELGTPILGDGKYGGAAARIAGVPGGSRLNLHARYISLPHPSGTGRIEVAAPLPPPMAETWRFFGFDAAAEAKSFDDVAGPSLFLAS